MSGLGLGYQSCENRDIAGRLSVLRWCGGVGGWLAWTSVRRGVVVICPCEL